MAGRRIPLTHSLWKFSDFAYVITFTSYHSGFQGRKTSSQIQSLNIVIQIIGLLMAKLFILFSPSSGFFIIDRFADADNRSVHRFDSRCPPFSQIGDTLWHARLYRCKGVLLVPGWKSSNIWPLLTSDGVTFCSFL